MNIEIDPKSLISKFVLLVGLLLCANILGLISKFYLDHENIHGLVPLFDFNTERNVPTFYSACALAISGLLSYLVGANHKRNGGSYIPWMGLGAIFLFLSIDEISQLHENLADPVRDTFNTSGLLFYAWVIPYGIAFIIFGLAYSRFLWRLPRKTMVIFVIGGITFLTGAVGLELFGGLIDEGTDHKKSLPYAMLYTVEELFEMLGIIIFIYGLLTYITDQFETFTFTIKDKNKRS